MSLELVRGATDETIRAILSSMLHTGTDQAYEDIVVMAFQTRDVRGGAGERELFYKMMTYLYDIQPLLCQSLLDLVPEYGSWDDMFTLANRLPLKASILDIAVKQLLKDESEAASGGSISLLGKWAPREGRPLATEFAHLLCPTGKHSQIMSAYRKRLSRLNAALNTVETLECSNRWDTIDPTQVPRSALRIKKLAYLNTTKGGAVRKPNDEKRMACREHFLASEPSAIEPQHAWRYDPVRERVREWLRGGWRI